MTTAQFKVKYEAIQKEARAIATELKPISRRYQSLCEKATALGVSAKYDARLYRKHDKHGYNEPDGWDINTLSRLDDLDELLLQDVRSLLLNLADHKFGK